MQFRSTKQLQTKISTQGPIPMFWNWEISRHLCLITKSTTTENKNSNSVNNYDVLNIRNFEAQNNGKQKF